MTNNSLIADGVIEPGGPLWGRVPTHDVNGKPVSDFMMLIPRFSRWPDVRREQALQRLEQVFQCHQNLVVFADLNLKLNLLWVSLKVCSGGCQTLVGAVRKEIPEAVLIASHAEVLGGMANQERRKRFRLKLPWFG